MTVPKVGAAVRGSKTGRPIMVVLDLLGRRAALRILWELRGDPLTFRALQEGCETNPSLLNTRIKELRAAGLVEHLDGGYRLTREGRNSAWRCSHCQRGLQPGAAPPRPPDRDPESVADPATRFRLPDHSTDHERINRGRAPS
jgi:DNA-binding HxlR family transcriptional regulator